MRTAMQAEQGAPIASVRIDGLVAKDHRHLLEVDTRSCILYNGYGCSSMSQ